MGILNTYKKIIIKIKYDFSGNEWGFKTCSKTESSGTSVLETKNTVHGSIRMTLSTEKRRQILRSCKKNHV